MQNVKVWNKNHLPFKQKFEDSMIEIPAGHFIIMDFEKAHKFKGLYYPVEVDAGGRQLPKSFKKITIERIDAKEEVQAKKHLCQACGFIGLNEKDLESHIDENHINQMVDKKEREKRLKAMNK